jgi:hypothetical protein
VSGLRRALVAVDNVRTAVTEDRGNHVASKDTEVRVLANALALADFKLAWDVECLYLRPNSPCG